LNWNAHGASLYNVKAGGAAVASSTALEGRVGMVVVVRSAAVLAAMVLARFLWKVLRPTIGREEEEEEDGEGEEGSIVGASCL